MRFLHDVNMERDIFHQPRLVNILPDSHQKDKNFKRLPLAFDNRFVYYTFIKAYLHFNDTCSFKFSICLDKIKKTHTHKKPKPNFI